MRLKFNLKRFRFRFEKFKTYPTFLFGNLGALSIIDDTTLLRRNIFTDLILNSLTLLLVDYLTLSLSSRCALLFLYRVTSILESVAALLVVFS